MAARPSQVVDASQALTIPSMPSRTSRPGSSADPSPAPDPSADPVPVTPTLTPTPSRPPSPSRNRCTFQSPSSASAKDLHGPRTPSPPQSFIGYESPNEENHPEFFLHGQRHRMNPRSQHQSSGNGASTPTGRVRPGLASRPSHMVSYPPHLPNNGSSLNELVTKSEKFPPGHKVSIKDRIACYRWTYFTMTMATGGIANCLSTLPWRTDWIYGIGVFFFLLNICLFLMNCILISIRFGLRPGSFTNSFTDQVESLFIPAFFVSLATVLIGICAYGVGSVGPWLLRTMEVMFWVYVALSTVASAGMYLILWSTLVFPVHMMTPTWVFPAYPLLLTAPFAGQLIAAAQRSESHASVLDYTAVAFCAVTTQGTGCLIAFMISAAFLYRLMTQKLPRDMQRPGVFISIGPFGFTAAGIAQIASQADIIVPNGFFGGLHTAEILRVIGILVSLWLWGLSMWFFLVSVGSLWKYARSGHHLPFQMTWWSFIFPNTALVMATEIIGHFFQSKGLQIFGAVMTVALILVWILVFITMLRCLKQRKLLWPKEDT